MNDAPPLAEQVDEKRAEIGRAVARRLADMPSVERHGNEEATVYAVREFLTDEECTRLIELIDAIARPSDLFRKEDIEQFRTSSSGDLDRYDPLVSRIDRRIDELLGLPNAHGETIQGQRYAPGQFFRTHADFFYISEPYWPDMEKCGGQRTWTAMIYLNQPDSGGGTRFDRLDLEMKPETGTLLAWNNMNADGAPNEWTFHQGCDVGEGTKYIVTKWYRENVWFASDTDAMSLAAGGASPTVAEEEALAKSGFRTATMDDIEQLASVLADAGIEAHDAVLRANMAKLIGAGLPPVVAVGNGEIVAFCCPTVTQMLHSSAPMGRISSMIVSPDHAGEKIGEALVAEAEARLLALGCKQIEVTSSDAREDAHAFYERLGYRRTSARFVKTLD